MAFQVGDAILFFSVDGFLKLFPDCGALAFGVGVVRLDIGDDDGEHLRAEAQVPGGSKRPSRGPVIVMCASPRYSWMPLTGWP